jgi:hypothetical protein
MQLLDLHQDARLGRDAQARGLSAARRRRRPRRLSVRHQPVHHLFCKDCGVQLFSRGHVPQLGGDYVAVRLATLDDVPVEDLTEAPMRFFNGRDNKWWEPPDETRHL